MKCPAYSFMNIAWHTVWFLQVWTEEDWQKILQQLGLCGCLWSIILSSIMKSCCGHLSQMFVNFSVSHSMCVLCSLWNIMESCFIVPSFEAGTILLSKCVVIFTMEHLRWLLCNWLWDIHTIWKILMVGIKVSLPTVMCLCHFLLILVLKGYVWIYISLHKAFLT